MRARIFIDFWNFQINWNQLVGQNSIGKRCDWKRLPIEILNECEVIFKAAGIDSSLDLEETLVYVSVGKKLEKDKKLSRWLNSTLNSMPSYRVKVTERELRTKKVHCTSCGHNTTECSQCGQQYTGRPEKGVDVAMVTDLLSLAFQDDKKSYDVAVLVTSDADFIPAVDYLQGAGLKVINGCWPGQGHNLKGHCWGHVNLSEIAQRACR